MIVGVLRQCLPLSARRNGHSRGFTNVATIVDRKPLSLTTWHDRAFSSSLGGAPSATFGGPVYEATAPLLGVIPSVQWLPADGFYVSANESERQNLRLG